MFSMYLFCFPSLFVTSKSINLGYLNNAKRGNARSKDEHKKKATALFYAMRVLDYGNFKQILYLKLFQPLINRRTSSKSFV